MTSGRSLGGKVRGLVAVTGGRDNLKSAIGGERLDEEIA